MTGFNLAVAEELLYRSARLRGRSSDEAEQMARLPLPKPERGQRKRRTVHEAASSPATGESRREVTRLLATRQLPVAPFTESARRMLRTARNVAQGRPATRFDADKAAEWLGRLPEEAQR